jgi:hypothetical protein
MFLDPLEVYVGDAQWAFGALAAACVFAALPRVCLQLEASNKTLKN